MLYCNPEFFLFFAVVLSAYLSPISYENRFRLLLGGSVFFYAWAGFFDAAIFFFVVAVSWAAVALAHRAPARKRFFLGMGIAVMGAHLFFWKYATWATGQIRAVCPGFLWGIPVNLPLPVGISFFTLQGIAYLADFSRGKAEFMGLKRYLLFKSFFAQLVAGPIVRSHQLLPQLKSLPRSTPADVSAGLALFTLGLFKKVVIADRTALFVDAVFAAPSSFGRRALVLGLLGYTVQIWADFSGYTDMGRGCARMLGIRLPENFLSPYLARGPSEFWRRWHITLSEWIRDYIYIPLGGGRGSPMRVLGVVVLTMAISGFWHGANWTFLIWGLYHGALLVLERRFPWKLPAALAGSLMLAATIFGWLIFRSAGLDALGAYLAGLVHGTGGGVPAHAKNVYLGLGFCGLIQVLGYRNLETGAELWRAWAERLETKYGGGAGGERFMDAAGILSGACLAAMLIGSLALRPTVQKAFIYFQF